MSAAPPPRLDDVRDARAWRISAGDTVVLAPIRRPTDRDDTSVCLEVWEPGGSQPPNSHPRSVETFVFLDGTGVAVSDDTEVEVRAGQVLTLPAGSLHHIRNTGPGRMRALTVMAPDDGFVDLIEAGEPTVLEPADLAVLATSVGSVAEVEEAVAAYDRALVDGRADDAAGFFASSGSRFGPEGSAWDHEEVVAVRRATTPPPPPDLVRSEVDPLSATSALVRTEMRRGDRTVLRTQVWSLTDGGWRIVHAHVSSPVAATD